MALGPKYPKYLVGLVVDVDAVGVWPELAAFHKSDNEWGVHSTHDKESWLTIVGSVNLVEELDDRTRQVVDDFAKRRRFYTVWGRGSKAVDVLIESCPQPSAALVVVDDTISPLRDWRSQLAP